MTGDRRTVEVDRVEYDLLVLDAAAWRLLNTSPHVAEILAEWVEWAYRSDQRDIAAAICAGADWRREATVPTYDELRRRRAVHIGPELTPAEIRARAAASWAQFEQQHRGKRSA
ncbi:hypothetical protein AB0K15_46660 [Amycolatopsis sp. NPDC049253]|uniref:hypothetical protein n=1 Tax=Amycolatopsis sp. NPDC049253 TaxID=3155274 RepID=UPI003424F1EC